MYIHSHLTTSKDIITFVYCTYKHMLQWPQQCKHIFLYIVTYKTCVSYCRMLTYAVLR